MDDKALVSKDEVTLDMAQGVAHWDIKHSSPAEGLYTGRFTFKVMLSPLQEIEADRDYRELLGKNAEFVSTHIEKLAYILAQLKQRVHEAPPFWNNGLSRFPGSHIKDQDVLLLVSEASLVAELKYRESLREKRSGLLEKMKKDLEKQSEEDKENEDLGE